MSSDRFTPQVATLRESITQLQAERSDCLRRKLSRDEAKAHFEAVCENAAERAGHVAHCDAGRLMAGASGHSALLALAGHHGARYDEATLRDVFALICAALGRKALRGLYLPALDALPAGLDAKPKVVRLVEIASELDRLEAQEERLICEAAEQGVEIQRRADARPEIVLAVRVDSEGGDHD